MNKDKIRKRISVDANGDIPVPPCIDPWKLDSKRLCVAVYCRVATMEQTDCSKKASDAHNAYADITGGSDEEG